MRQGKKNGREWKFGMKVHVGTSKQGLVHSIVTGPANEADITKLDGLLHGAEQELYGDQAYWSEDHRQQCKHAGIHYRVNRRPATAHHPLSEYQRTINRARSRCRARGEHAFMWSSGCGVFHGSLPRPGQEHGAHLRPVRLGQPVPGATTTVAPQGATRPRTKNVPPTAQNPRQKPHEPEFGRPFQS